MLSWQSIRFLAFASVFPRQEATERGYFRSELCYGEFWRQPSSLTLCLTPPRRWPAFDCKSNYRILIFGANRRSAYGLQGSLAVTWFPCVCGIFMFSKLCLYLRLRSAVTERTATHCPSTGHSGTWPAFLQAYHPVCWLVEQEGPVHGSCSSGNPHWPFHICTSHL